MHVSKYLIQCNFSEVISVKLIHYHLKLERDLVQLIDGGKLEEDDERGIFRPRRR